jgi:glutamate/tyrosine decarboxylase-like PLP-dependent enzyme
LGRSGCEFQIRNNIALASLLHQAVADHPLLEAITQGLSISTFRYLPEDLRDSATDPSTEEYLNLLNERLLTALQHEGAVYLSNGVLDGRFVLRTCIVNFRTREVDVQAVPEIVAERGKTLDASLRNSRQSA